MHLYTIHLGSKNGQNDIVSIKEGFSWPAVLFSVFWMLWHRLWWIAVIPIMINALIYIGIQALHLSDTQPYTIIEQTYTTINLGLAILCGFWGNDLRRQWLVRRNYQEVDVISAEDSEIAIVRYLRKMTFEQKEKPT